jgi:hypothetical protein
MSRPLHMALAALAVLSLSTARADSVWVGRFTATDGALPPPWRVERIDQRVPPTRYAVRRWDGVDAVEALASKSMALLGRPLRIDLDKTPILCWLWRVDAPVASADMTRKSGDDYAARVYLNFDIPAEQLDFATRSKLALARTLFGSQLPDAALNYVWDNVHPVGTLQDNAYTDRARLLVLRSGGASAGHWVSERRHVPRDFARAFGAVHGHLRMLVLASDTDNTGEDAHAGFADFRFVATEAECPEASANPL